MLRVWALPVLALICAVPWAVIRLVMGRPVRRAAIEALFVGYMGVLLYLVFLPLPVRPDDASLVLASVNLVPARTVVGIIRDFPGLVIQQLLGNVVLFVPLGFLLPLLSTRYRRFALTAAVGLAVSLGIELVQFALLLTLIARRSVDVDDVILNVTGACLGYLVWRGAHAHAALLVSSLLLGAAICAQAQTAPAVQSDVHHVQFTKADPGSRGDGWAVVRQVLDLPPRHAGGSHRPEVTARGTHRDRRSANVRRKGPWRDGVSPTGVTDVDECSLPALCGSLRRGNSRVGRSGAA